MILAPAADRNKDFILEVLKEYFVKPPEKKTKGKTSAAAAERNKLQVLEIASGTGQHVAHFAQSLGYIHWIPSEVDEKSMASIQAFIDNHGLQTSIASPVRFDVTEPVEESALRNRKSYFDGIVCTNMVHISPWACTEGLFAVSQYLLKPKGLLVTYGPYSVNGILTPKSNVDFDTGLRLQNPEWGVRDTTQLIKVGQLNSLQFVKSIEMPANNKMLIFQKE